MTPPLRVTLLGSSVSLLVTGPRSEGTPHLTYASYLDRLTDGPRDFQVSNLSRIYGLVSDFASAWAYPLSQTRPDVVVLQFGLGEAFPRLVPRPFVTFLLGVGRRQGRVRRQAWRGARPLLMRIHAVERKVDRLLPDWWARMSPDRFEHELRALAAKINEQIGARLIVMTSYRATDRAPFHGPPMDRRVEENNRRIMAVAASVGAEVFDLGKVIEGLGETALPDGLHMSVEAHRMVATALADMLAGD